MWSEARDLLFSLSETLERTARHADLIPLLEAGVRQSHAAGDRDSHALLQIRLALLIMSQAEGTRAHALLTEARDYFHERQDPLHIGQALNGLGRWASQRGDWDEATARATEALAILPPTAYDDRAISYRLLGAVAVDRQKWPEAHAAYQESLRLWQQGSNARYIGFGWVNAGSALRGLGRYEEAATALREGILRFEAAEDLVNRALAQINLGNLYLARAQYHEAIEQYHAAESLFRQLNRISELARLYNNWGMAYAGLERWQQSVSVYEQSLRYWRELQNSAQQANALDNLGLALMALGRFAEGANAFRTALAALDEGGAAPVQIEIRQHLAEAERHIESAAGE
jgi:tetratricopeptide (TPR) repeat protein